MNEIDGHRSIHGRLSGVVERSSERRGIRRPRSVWLAAQVAATVALCQMELLCPTAHAGEDSARVPPWTVVDKVSAVLDITRDGSALERLRTRFDSAWDSGLGARPSMSGPVLGNLSPTEETSAAAAQWRTYGPDGTWCSRVAPAPWDPAILYASFWSELYRGTLRPDDTVDWVYTGFTLDAHGVFGLDPWHANTLYATNANSPGGTLYKSTDGGFTWNGVGPGLPNPLHVRRIAFHPANPTVVYIVDNEQALYVSSNQGASWTARNSGLPTGFIAGFAPLAIDPTNPSIVYIASDIYGVFKSTDAGASWSEVNNGLPQYGYEGFVLSLALDLSSPSTLYAGVWPIDPWGGAYKTTDGGTSWWKMDGLPRGAVSSLIVDPQDPQVVYAMDGQDIYDPPIAAGVHRSTDRGATWEPRSCIEGAIALDTASTPDRLYLAAREGGALKSTDGGASFTHLNDPPPRSVVIYSLAFADSDPRVAYAGSLGRVSKTTDGGRSWRSTGYCSWTYIWALAVDPTNPDIVYGAPFFPGRIFKSSDGGSSWFLQEFEPWPSTSNVIDIAIDPSSPQTLYIATVRGLYKTTNGGATWIASNNGIHLLYIIDVAIAPSNPMILYAGTVNGGVFKSVTGGAVWFEAGAGLPPPVDELGEPHDVYAYGLSVHPTDPNIVYVCTDMPYAINSQVGTYKTETGGAAWLRVDSTPYPLATAIDPAHPETVYQLNSGIRVSADGGGSWSTMNQGLTYPYVTCFAVDPTGTRLLAGSPPGVYLWEDPSAVSVGDDRSTTSARVEFRSVEPSPVTSGTATFHFHLTSPGRVAFDVLDVSGRMVSRSSPRFYAAGPGEMRWSAGGDAHGRALAAGVYLVRMTAEGRLVGSQRMVLLR